LQYRFRFKFLDDDIGKQFDSQLKQLSDSGEFEIHLLDSNGFQRCGINGLDLMREMDATGRVISLVASGRVQDSVCPQSEYGQTTQWNVTARSTILSVGGSH